MTDLRIPQTPDTLTRAQVINACKALGLDPAHVRALHVEPHQVTVETWPLSPDHGARILAGVGYYRATATIPVTREDA